MKQIKKTVYSILLAGVTLSACNNDATTNTNNNDSNNMKTTSLLPDANNFRGDLMGKKVALFILKNNNGLQAAFTNYGARWVTMLVPDKNNALTDVIVGHDDVNNFAESGEPFFGATIGRYGNRIKNGQFTLDGKKYELDVNNGPNTLHGGKGGFHNVMWDGVQQGDSSVVFTYLSKDGEMGFPGNLNIKVIYTLGKDNAMHIAYEASTDKKTVVNLTNHAFFNLNGVNSGTINNHLLQVMADEYTPVDSTLIPTGTMENVSGTPFDFTQATAIGARVNDSSNTQLKYGKGYDHNFVLRKGLGNNPVAIAQGDASGIVMTVFTEEPGLQFYGGNFMQSKNTIKGGKKDDFRTSFCLETQHFPDSPNQPGFPPTVLEPGQIYRTQSSYQFSVTK